MGIRNENNGCRPVGRFAPSPSGRMHLGNVFTAVVSWLSVKSRGGRWILRIEDLDPQRSKIEHARMIEDDLRWLGLAYDEGGLDGTGNNGPYCQSLRHDVYSRYLDVLRATGMTYPCFCTRADILATQAPHASDGRVVYGGRCRPSTFPSFASEPTVPHSVRLAVGAGPRSFADRVFGVQTVDLARECGDFVVRRADGAWAYQFAVVVDDALMGVTEVVRGCDLLSSSAQQEYLYDLLGFEAPQWAHVPLLCNESGQRLSKRDGSLSMEALRRRYSREELLGLVAYIAGQQKSPEAISLDELLDQFDLDLIPKTSSVKVFNFLST